MAGALLALGLVLAVPARAATLTKPAILSDLEQYRAKGLLISLHDWAAHNPNVTPDNGGYAVMMSLLAQQLRAADPALTVPPRLNQLYQQGALNIYVIRGSIDAHASNILQRTGATGNAALVFDDIVLIDADFLDGLTDLARPSTPCLTSPADCSSWVGTHQDIAATLPYWIVWHEAGHWFYETVHKDFAPTIREREIRADTFAAKLGTNGNEGFITAIISATMMNVALEQYFHRSWNEVLSSNATLTVPLSEKEHPPLFYRLLTLSTAFESRSRFVFEIGCKALIEQKRMPRRTKCQTINEKMLARVKFQRLYEVAQ
jgi:hypothetical protein